MEWTRLGGLSCEVGPSSSLTLSATNHELPTGCIAGIGSVCVCRGGGVSIKPYNSWLTAVISEAS